MKDKQVKMGVLLSYVLIIINTLYGLFLTPYIIGRLGDAEYGVYKVISSLSSSLMVLDLGLGSTVMRYIASYQAKNEKEKIPNFVAMSLIQGCILCCVVLIISGGVFFSIKPIYAATFTEQQIHKAQILFSILTINMIVHVIENVINGVITGSNCFTFGNGIKVIRLCLRITCIFFLLQVFSDSIVLVLVDLCITVTFLVVEVLYIRFSIGIHIRYSNWDKTIFLESGKYTILMFLTSIAAQVNNNLDNVIIGAISGPELVTIYSIGLLIFTMFENLSTSVSGVMLPTVANILEEKNGDKKIQDLIIKVGRIQFILLGAAVVGFLCIGRDFIYLWMGDKFEDVYLITLILMIPSLFELCVNVCLAILRAKNILIFRTTVLCASTVLNAVVTILSVKYWSYIGAAVGTASSFVIGSLIIMNIYYHKKLGFPMLKIYARIVSRIWLCLIISGGGLYIISRILTRSWLSFVLEVLIFCVIYIITLLTFGLTKNEKHSIPIIGRVLK